MFNFFKNKMRKEHLKLVSESLQMGRQLQRVYKSGSLVLSDPNSAITAEYFIEMLLELEKIEIQLDHNEHLPMETASELLNLYQVLKAQVQQVDYARNQVRQRFSE
jgi:hypothetical protein